jgi:predicted ATP-dependent serine protease
MVHHDGAFSGIDAWSLLKSTQENAFRLVTMCRSIDEMLGGGIRIGQITEFAGPPGIGKSQLA